MEIELAFQTNNLLIFPIFIKNRLVNAFHPCQNRPINKYPYSGMLPTWA